MLGFFIALMIAALSSPPSIAMNEQDHAIVVGFSDYELKGDHRALHEAPLAFYRWLVEDPDGPRLPKKNVIGVGNVGGIDLLQTRVDDAFEKILERKGRRLYIYMSGVGRRSDGDVALVSPRGPSSTINPAMPIVQYADAARASGAFDGVVLFADFLVLDFPDRIEPRFGTPAGTDRPYFYAYGLELPNFTNALLRGLRGEARNENGNVTSKSLERYLQSLDENPTIRRNTDNFIVVGRPEPQPSPERVAAHADDPAVVDELGRRPFAEVVGDRILEVWKDQKKRAEDRRQSDLAFMVHIHGPWGSGKTSVLNFLRAYLREHKRVVVEFNAWRHQRMRPPWWALIHTVYSDAFRQLGIRSIPLWATWWLRQMRMAWAPVLLTVLALVGAIWAFRENLDTGLKLITTLATAAGVTWAYSRTLVFGSSRAAQTYTELRSDPLGPIVKLFNKVIRAIEWPVVVFIDDLDRCESRYVIELLEGIQTLFRSAPVTYVVAADRKWICSSFEQTYEPFGHTIGEPGRPLGYLFLEKVFQVSVSVPRLPDDVQKAYWAGLLRTGEAVEPNALGDRRKEAEEKARQVVSGATTHEQIQAIVDAETGGPIERAAIRAAAAKQITNAEAQKETEHRLQRFAGLLEPNPRAMKRLVNAYGLHQATHFLEGRSVDPEALALWTIIELRWPLLAEYLAAWPHSVETKDVPESLRPLFAHQEVRAVAKDLDPQAIGDIIGR